MTASIEGLDRIVVQLAPGAKPAADPETFAWVDAGPRRTSAPIAITAGRDDEASTVEAGSMSALMDDRNGDLSPRNVLGQWYGGLKRGTPTQVIWPRTTDDFTRTAVAGGWGTNAEGYAWTISNPDHMATDGTRAVSTLPFNNASRNRLLDASSLDVEIVWSFSVPVMPTGGAAIVAGLLRDGGSTDNILVNAELHPDGTVATRIYRRTASGFVVLRDTLNVTTAGVNTKVWAKARIEGAWIMVKLWTGVRGDEPADWDATATDNVCEGSGTGLFPWRLNTNVGTYTVYIDDFELTNILWTGNVPEWPVRWPDKSGNDCVTPLEAAGVLRRIRQGNGTIRSPLRRHLSGLSRYVRGYLPLEDQSDATRAAPGTARGQYGTVVGGTFAGDDTLPGSDPTLVLNTVVESRVSLSPKSGSVNGYAIMCLFKATGPVTAERTLLDIRAVGDATRWQVYVNGSSYGFRGYDTGGNLIADNAATYGGGVPQSWTAIQLETTVTGGTTSVTLFWHPVGSTEYLFTADSYSGSTATSIISVIAQAVTDSMSIAHLWVGDDELPFVGSTFSKVANGYIGEEAGARITRLATETGTPAVALSGASEPMGRQTSGKVLDLFRECEAADLGVLYERGNGLTYRPRVRRYTPSVAMALDWAAGHLDAPPEPQDDDQRLANYVTVTRVGGSSSVAEDEDSIEDEGVYEDSRDLLIATDDRLDDFAAWLLHLGTSNDLRWPRIRINLVAHPELIPAWLGCTIGSRITIANPPSQIFGEVIDLIIEGYSQQINVDQWTVEMSCSPARPWLIGGYDRTDQTSKWGVRSTTVLSGATSSATTFTVKTTEDEPLSSTSTFGIVINGELITVPVAGAAARTGTAGNWQQVLTGLTRAVNGVAKAIPADAVVEIYNTGKWGL
jgi:hypothetical protein